MSLLYERLHAATIITEKRAQNFDKVVEEWRAKVMQFVNLKLPKYFLQASDLQAELEASNNKCRNYNSELFRLKASWEEDFEQLDVVKRENINLAEEIFGGG